MVATRSDARGVPREMVSAGSGMLAAGMGGVKRTITTMVESREGGGGLYISYFEKSSGSRFSNQRRRRSESDGAPSASSDRDCSKTDWST